METCSAQSMLNKYVDVLVKMIKFYVKNCIHAWCMMEAKSLNKKHVPINSFAKASIPHEYTR